MWKKVVLVLYQFLADLGLLEIKPPPPAPAPHYSKEPASETDVRRVSFDTTSHVDLVAHFLRQKAKHPGLYCSHCKTLVRSDARLTIVNEPMMGWMWRCPQCHHPNEIKELRRG